MFDAQIERQRIGIDLDNGCAVRLVLAEDGFVRGPRSAQALLDLQAAMMPFRRFLRGIFTTCGRETKKEANELHHHKKHMQLICRFVRHAKHP